MPAPIDTAWPADWLRPVFSSPRVGAVMTTRAGGVSQAPWDSLNLRDEVGDDPLAVRENRARLHAAIGRPSVLLAQVHGAEVCLLEDLPPGAEQAPPAERVRADGCATAASVLACEIQVADCLPVLFADRQGVRSARPMRAGADWLLACSRPRSRGCAVWRAPHRTRSSAGSGPASGRRTSRSARKWWPPFSARRRLSAALFTSLRRAARGDRCWIWLRWAASACVAPG